jgi:hypothetical protein
MPKTPVPADVRSLNGTDGSRSRTPLHGDHNADGVEPLDAMTRRFDETMGRARALMAAMNRTADELAGLEDATERRRRMLGDLALELGG